MTSNRISRRMLLTGLTGLAGLAAGATGIAGAATRATSYAAFRVVRKEPGDPAKPEITLPDGYAIVAGDKHSVASRAEFYTFVEGPTSESGIEVKVRWPDVEVETVITQEDRLELTPDPDDPYAFTFTLPVVKTSINATQGTIQVWSYLSPDHTDEGIFWKVEHNDPDRVAGPWTEVPWPEGQVRSVIHQLFASDAVLRDSGLAATAAGKGHIFALMGFETNNTLHPDNPPHWHLAYFAGPNTSAPAYLPHIWFDEKGRNFYNGMDVTGQGRTEYRVGDPAPLYDFADNLVVTLTIREDGGLDIEPPDGPRYAITAGSDDLLADVLVEKDGEAWLTVTSTDDVHQGVFTATINDETRTFEYDRLTGVLR